MKRKPFPYPDTRYAGIDLSHTKYVGLPNKTQAAFHRRREDDGIIDTVAVCRALAGEHVRISNREVLAAIALGATLGLSDVTLGDRLDMPARNIFQKRKDNNISPSVPPRWTEPNREDVA